MNATRGLFRKMKSHFPFLQRSPADFHLLNSSESHPLLSAKDNCLPAFQLSSFLLRITIIASYLLSQSLAVPKLTHGCRSVRKDMEKHVPSPLTILQEPPTGFRSKYTFLTCA